MAVQQCKKSKQRSRQRRASKRYKGLLTTPCPHCGAARQCHCICAKCGYYKDRQVITVKVD